MASLDLSSAGARLSSRAVASAPRNASLSFSNAVALRPDKAQRALLSQRTSRASPAGSTAGHGSLKARAVVNTATADAAQDAPASSTPGASAGNRWAVHKFGGTCVGTPERIANVASIISEDSSARKFVIVSAMSQVTNALYALLSAAESGDEGYTEQLAALWQKHKEAATELMGEGSPDLETFLALLEGDVKNLQAMLRAIFIARNATETFTDFVVGHGELWSAQILAATVQKITGKPCAFLDARDVLVVKPAEGGQQVDPDYAACQLKIDSWLESQGEEEGKGDCSMVVATGFIARTPEGVPTTLKRDGSDFSAAIFGALLQAGKVTIWTDVDGVYSADPRKVTDAVILKELTYQEAWEMSYFGAKVIHPRTTLPVMKYGTPIYIRNAFNTSAPGTKIGSPATAADEEQAGTGEEPGVSAWGALGVGRHLDESAVKGFATVDNVALINVEGTGMAGVPGTASQIFTAVKNVGANVIAISQASSEHSVCFAVPESESDVVASALAETFERAIESGRISTVGVIRKCSILAAVGQRMASTPGVSAALFGALAKASVNVRAIAQGCSEYNITVVVDGNDSVKALRAVHSRFYLSRTPLAVALIGPGLIGATLLQQIKDQAEVLKTERNIDLRVVAVASSGKMLLSNDGLDLGSWREEFTSKAEAADLQKLTEHLLVSTHLPNTVVVDCTASDSVGAVYPQWLSRGIHIVTPNKKANSGPLDLYLRMKAAQLQSSAAQYLYEGTVGAGLPIISTLQGLLNTGDKIRRIEGIFSGTLSYIFNTFDGQKPFSQIVTEAKAAGYTEPDPRDDLAGMDVARKVIILAREAGLLLELADVPVESLVPEPLQTVASADEYLSRLPEFDAQMEAQRKDAEDKGEVLRYVGVVDVEKGEGRVELRRYPRDHAFAQLSGSDNIISFTTSRYSAQPLIVRGPGAGAEVTAGGVFSDLLRLASCLGALV